MKLHETLEEDDYRYIRESPRQANLNIPCGKFGTIELILPFSCTVSAIWNTFPEYVKLYMKTFYVFYTRILTNKMYQIKYKKTHTIKYTSR
jgi:hypothetical protein